MKKFLTLLLAVMMIGIFTACKETKPEFKFNLNLTGDVSDSATDIQGDFNVKVLNFTPNSEQVLAASAPIDSTSEEAVNAYDWLDNYIQANVISEMGPSTTYEIKVTGLINEVNSGITLTVDKVFTNKPKDN